MIKVSVLYPAGESTKFDMNYYCTSHMPMARDKFGAACKGMSIEQGLAGAPLERRLPMLRWAISCSIRSLIFRLPWRHMRLPSWATSRITAMFSR